MDRSQYKNLIIIGNGFDIWQHIPSSYESFRVYYHEHTDSVIEEAGLPYAAIKNINNNEEKMLAVDIVYGADACSCCLTDDFFWNFESSLGDIDEQAVINLFGRSDEELLKLENIVNDAKFIMRKIFSDWIATFNIQKGNSGYLFTDDCYIINFNYTDTVEKRFGVLPANDYHIHGSASEPSSIIFGHVTHPETAFNELVERHFIKSVNPDNSLPRIRGLYAIEKLLYETDKHTADRIDDMCEQLYRQGVHIEDIENVYVLGHSFGEVDYEYFNYIDKITRCGCDYDLLSAVEQLDPIVMEMLLNTEDEDIQEDTLFELIVLNIRYAMHQRERKYPNRPELYPELKTMFGENENYTKEDESLEKFAVRQRFLWEQAIRTQDRLLKIAKIKGINKIPEGCHSVLGLADFLDMGHARRLRNAKWHITYYSDKDKHRVKSVMKRLGLKRYTLYSNIDECIGKFATTPHSDRSAV